MGVMEAKERVHQKGGLVNSRGTIKRMEMPSSSGRLDY